MKKTLFITTVIVSLSVSFILPIPALAQDNTSDNIDQIIHGLEDEAVKDGALQDLMQGFEAETPAAEPDHPLVEDDFIQGFDETSDEQGASQTLETKPATSWSIDGELAFTTVYNFSSEAEGPWRNFSMLRPELELTLKNRFSDQWRGQIGVRGFYDAIYVLRGREKYTQQVIDEYESELELRDTYIQGSLTQHLDMKFGRQIVAWGTLNNLRVTDVLNPLDVRLPGLIDIEDLRLPVTMAKLDYYFGNWDISAMAIPEVRFSKRAVYGSDFWPYQDPAPPEVVPDHGFENAEYAAALTGVFSGWDVGFYGAHIYTDDTYVEPAGQLVARHPRINLLGSAANLALGNWLFKAEAAWNDGLRYTNTPGEKFSRIDLGAGIEYAGFTETAVSLEAANRHLVDFQQSLEQPPDEIRENEFQWALRVTRDFINDTLTLTLLAGSFGTKVEDGAFQRMDAEYDITDAVSIRGGMILYQPGSDGRFRQVGGIDRLFAVIKHRF